MTRKRIGDIAIEVMKEEGSDSIGYNEFGMLDEVFSRAKEKGIVKEVGSRGGRNNPHPINNQNVVLNALGKDKRFEKFFIRCCSRTKEKEVLVREFKLKSSPNLMRSLKRSD